MSKFKQKGWNPDFPETVLAWKLGEPVPEWLSDVAKVEKIEESGEMILGWRKTNTGNLELLGSDGSSGIVKMKDENSYVLKSETHPLISLTPHQFELLYEAVRNHF